MANEWIMYGVEWDDPEYIYQIKISVSEDTEVFLFSDCNILNSGGCCTDNWTAECCIISLQRKIKKNKGKK